MTRTKKILSVAAAAVMLSGLATTRASAATPVKDDERELAQGARVVVGDCPLGEFTPPVDTVCEAYVVWWVRVETSTGPHPDRAPWHARVEHDFAVVHPDGTADELFFEVGEAITTGTYDERHLRTAHMDAVDVPLPGSNDVVHLGDFDWTAESDTYVWGANGPVWGQPHESWGCGHGNFLAHQKVTIGSVSGTIDGQSIDEMDQLVQFPGLQPTDATGAIFDSAFRYHVVDRC
jgi:hypothetical protein